MNNQKQAVLYPIDYPISWLVEKNDLGRVKIADGCIYNDGIIESILIRLPLPCVYAKEGEDKELVIIDGNKRLRAITGFVQGLYPLEGMILHPELNGKYFKDLDGFIQEDILNSTVRVIVLRKENSEEMVNTITNLLF